MEGGPSVPVPRGWAPSEGGNFVSPAPLRPGPGGGDSCPYPDACPSTSAGHSTFYPPPAGVEKISGSGAVSSNGHAPGVAGAVAGRGFPPTARTGRSSSGGGDRVDVVGWKGPVDRATGGTYPFGRFAQGM